MTRSAISANDRLGEAPIVSPSKPSPSSPTGRTSEGRSATGLEPTRWPGGEPQEPRQQSSGLSSLVLDRDQYGPIIAQRSSVEGKRRGQ